VYNVYGDESYDEKKEKVFAVAGVFGSDFEWARELMKDAERRFFSNSLKIRLSFEVLQKTKRFAGDFFC